MLKRRKSTTFKIVKWIVFAVFCIYAISLLVPFLWMLMNSFKSAGDYNSGNFFGLPKEWKFDNIIEVLKYRVNGETVDGEVVGGQTIFSMLCMSIITTVLGTFLNVGLSAISAYCVAKYNFPGKKFILGAAIFTMVVPIVGTLAAQIKMMEFFRIDDSLLGVLFLYSGCFGFNFIMLHSSFQTISWSYAEAAQIDGANRFQILFKVMIPLAKGPIIAVSILQAIVLWNDYSTPLLFLGDKTTLAVGLYQLQNDPEFAAHQPPMLFASVMLIVIPVVILFACFQKTIIKNTVAGGLKG